MIMTGSAVRISLPIIIIFACMVVAAAQSTVSQFDARTLPSIKNLVSAEDFDQTLRQLDTLEKNALKDARGKNDLYCDSLFNFVVFRYRLHRASPTLADAPVYNAPGAEEWLAYRNLLDKNVLRAEDLFTEGEKGCSKVGNMPTEAYLMGKFANVWLLDNFPAGLNQRIIPPGGRETRDKERDERLKVYEAVLNEYRSRPDKEWIDPVLLLLTYSNALVRRDQFDTAEPLLIECLTIAKQKYGADSGILLPILRLLAGITGLVGDNLEHQGYAEWITRLGGAEKDQEVLFDLIYRANPNSRPALNLESKILVAGPRADAGTPPDPNPSKFEYELPTADLPFAPGQGLRDNTNQFDRKFSQFAVRTLVTVSQTGDVISADVQNTNPKIRDRVLKVALGLKFKPMTYKGHAATMKGIVRIWVRYDYN